MDAEDKELVKDLFSQAAAMHKAGDCQQTYVQDGITTMCRFDTNQMLLLAQSLQSAAEDATSFSVAHRHDGNVADYARMHAAACRVLCRQLMLHLERALAEYEPEDEHGQHRPPSDILAQFGLRDAL